jgi:SAM-dependent methyltransferase
MPLAECRSCKSRSLRVVLDLGNHPLSDALLTSKREAREQPRYPLQLARCDDCTLLQVTETIPPQVLFQRDYPYFSSSSAALLQHAAGIAHRLIRELHLGPDSLVVEVASNDGYLLRNFQEKNIPCLGIDPASGPAGKALKAGIPVINDFFSLELATRLRAEGRAADLIIANNVVAHVDTINDFVAGFEKLLKPDGVAVLECAYAIDMVDKCEFDTIYHEHLFYHTLHGLMPLFARHGLYLNNAEKLAIHGGSLRFFVSRHDQRTARLQAMLAEEEARGIGQVDWCNGFSRRVVDLGNSLIGLLRAEKAKGASIACYGAAAKGSTLINYLDLGPDFFEFVADANPYKQGRFMPGQAIPIVHPGRLAETQPDLVLLLVWNFAGEVLRQQHRYRAAGGRFIIPIPEPRVIEPGERVDEEQFAVGMAGTAERAVAAAVRPGPVPGAAQQGATEAGD